VTDGNIFLAPNMFLRFKMAKNVKICNFFFCFFGGETNTFPYFICGKLKFTGIFEIKTVEEERCFLNF
jgi:hypothetical protein